MGNTGKMVLITGASSGFGEACSREYARQGSHLILTARSLDKLKALKSEIEAKHPTCNIFVAELDIQRRPKVNLMISGLPQMFSKIDILVNNAGLALGVEAAPDASLDDWETMVDTNIKGLLYMTKAVLSSMSIQGRGHIINIGSIAGNWPYPGGNVYGATKAFVQQFSRNLRSDLSGKMIRVSNIEPGLADTNFSKVRLKGDTKQADAVYAGTQPLLAEDIAEIVCWTSSIPEHVNINTLEVMPTCQSWGPFAIDRSNLNDET